MQVPKPTYKKKPKAKNNPVPTEEHICVLCCKVCLCETHEVYNGNPNRQISIKNGYQVKLCKTCHIDVTENREYTLEWQELWKNLYQQMQESAWKTQGISCSESRDMWLALIGKNYED